MPFLKSPLEIYWVLTNKCNIDCSFCFMDAEKYHGDGFELSAAQREIILNEIVENEVLKVFLTGGEPMLVPEIFGYIRTFRRHNIWVELTTNGTRLTENNIFKLKDCGLNAIQLSINGSEASINDELMGPSFARIVKTAELLMKQNFRVHFKVTVTRQNIRDVPNILRLAKRLGIADTTVDEIAPIGRGAANYYNLKPSGDDLVWLNHELQTMQARIEYESDLDSFTMDLEQENHGPICGLGDEDIYSGQIFQYGDLYQCTLSSVWKEKNSVLEKGLAKAWQDLGWLMDKYVNPQKLEGFCKTCGGCAGGCRPMAYIATGNVWGDFTYCSTWNSNEVSNSLKILN
jgi:pyrroloquinoline quinone biosynthesis protein E